MICGPSGTGKTSAAHAVAYSNGFDIIELNASDYRDSDTLGKKILPIIPFSVYGVYFSHRDMASPK